MFSRLLTADESLAVEDSLEFARRIVAAKMGIEIARPLHAEQLQEMFDAFLFERIDDEDSIRALGLSFGELLMRSGGLEWVRIRDEIDEENSLAVPGLRLYCSPISMIEKRLVDRQAVDLIDLISATLATLREQSESAKLDTRLGSDAWE